MAHPRKLVHLLLLTLCFSVSQVVCACPSFTPAGDGDGSAHVHATSHASGDHGHGGDAAHGPGPAPGHHGHDCAHCDLPDLGADATAARDLAPAPAQPSLAAVHPVASIHATPRPARAANHPPTQRSVSATPVTRRDLLLD